MASQVEELKSQIASNAAEAEKLSAQSQAAYAKMEKLRSQIYKLTTQSRVGLSNEQIANITAQQDALRLEIRNLSEEEESTANQAARLRRENSQLEYNLKQAEKAETEQPKATPTAAEAVEETKPPPPPEPPPSTEPAPTGELQEQELDNIEKAETEEAPDDSGVPAAAAPANDNVTVSTGADTADPGYIPPPEPEKQDKGLVVDVNGYSKPKPTKPNPLRDYNNYTYLVTLHLLDKFTHAQLTESAKFNQGGRVTFKSDNVLIASAGKYSEAGVRNPEWSEDFYIDNLKIDTVIGLHAFSQGANAVTTTFDIIEPYGLTLIERLIKSSLVTSYKNYLEMVYALQIDFVGYDDDGNIESIPNHTKYIPIKFTSLKFSVNEKGTVYKVQAVPYSHQAFNTSHASAPIAMSITASTVGDYFSASQVATQNNSGPLSGQAWNGGFKESASWCSAVNKYEINQHKANNKYIADTYNVVFDPEIGSSKLAAITAKEKTQITNTPMLDATGRRTASSDPRVIGSNQPTISRNAFDTQKSVVQYEAITSNVNAGTNLLSEINRIVRNSEYFIKQFPYSDPSAINQKTERELAEMADKNKKSLMWWKVIPEIKLKDFDYTRNTYAKDITYYVLPYEVQYNPYPYVPKRVPEPVKRYDYIFTGQNTEILDFNLDFNTTFYLAVTMDMTKLTTTGSAATTQAPGAQEIPPEFNKENLVNVQRQTQSGQNSATAGAGNRRDAMSALTADLQELLFAKPSGDLVTLSLKIVGDPDFIKQDDVFSGANRDAASLNNSIPMDTGDVYIRVTFKTPTDIDDETGLVKKSTTSKFSGLYRVTTVENSFAGGQFTQKLNAVRIYAAGDYDFETELTEDKPASRSLTNVTISRNAYDVQRTDAIASDTQAAPSTASVANETVSEKEEPAEPAVEDANVSTAEEAENKKLEEVNETAEETPIAEANNQPPVETQPANTNIPKTPSVTPEGTTKIDDGVYQFKDPLGKTNIVPVHTQDALDAVAKATKTGELVVYVDNDSNLGWVRVAYNPATGKREIQEELSGPPQTKN